MKRINWLLVLAVIGAAVVVAVPLATPVAGMTGSGTAGDPWIIMDVDDLQAIGTGSYALSHYYELGQDIDASSTATWNWNADRSVYEGWVPIDDFSGNFDGNGYSISGLYMDYNQSLQWVGLFGNVSPLVGSPTIKDVLIVDADISLVYSSSNVVHAGAGVLAGRIHQCHASISRVLVHGSVSVIYSDSYGNPIYSGFAGGLIGGLITSSVQISQCAAYVDVDYIGNRYSYGCAGGLIGGITAQYGASNYLTDCYARGSVTGVDEGSYLGGVGGLIGRLAATGTLGSATNCYSTGLVTAYGAYGGGLIGSMGGIFPVTACFWDTETSGQATSSGGGTGKTTLQMKTQPTFTNAGWDFDTIWSMTTYVNDGYPFFRWWYDPADMIEDIYQVVHFQPETIISGTTLPNRAGGGGVYPDGTFSWGANPAGIDIALEGLLRPEDVYYFEPIMPGSRDIIEPEPEGVVRDTDLGRLANNPIRPLVQLISSNSDQITERLAWLLLAIFIVIASMVTTQLLGQHIVFTSLVGLGLTSLFYSMGVWGLWVVILMVFGLVASIVYERMPTL